ncbi:major facilitator superfamily domain-containing protein [Hyaloraphidium curvatum]|nr:major facilitator superfamily domain-containing protein [Hyaloraphidium curvatum]
MATGGHLRSAADSLPGAPEGVDAAATATAAGVEPATLPDAKLAVDFPVTDATNIKIEDNVAGTDPSPSANADSDKETLPDSKGHMESPVSDVKDIKIEDDAAGMDPSPSAKADAPKEAAPGGDIGPPPNGGLAAWLQVLSNFFIHFFGVGWSNAIGVLVAFYIRTGYFGPNINQTAISLMAGAAQCIGFLIGPLIGIMSDKFGYRPISAAGSAVFGLCTLIAGFSNGSYAMVFVFQGFLQMLGFMACWIPSMGAVAQWFTTRRGLAISIGGAGAGLGGLALGPLTNYMLNTIGFQWTMMTMGLVLVVALVPCSLMIKTRVPPRRRGPVMDWSAFRSMSFVLLFCGCLFCYFAFPLPLFFLPTYATQNGVSSSMAAIILGVTTAVSAPSRLLQGLLMDRIGGVNVFAMACGVGSITCFALAPFAKNVGLLFVFAILYGSTAGCFMSFIPACTAQIFGVQSAASKLGLIYMSLALGSVLGTFTGGQILTANTVKPPDGPPVSDFTPFWMFCGACWAVGCLFLIGLKVAIKGWNIFSKV